MFQKYIDALITIRTGETALSDFAYDAITDDDGITIDANGIKRFQLIKALQYDRKVGDEKILQELLKYEIITHKKSSLQGLYSSLRLCAYLLSSFKTPENVWLFIDAKNANFDTNCGFDYQFLVSAGIKETYEYIVTTDHELSEFQNYVGETKDTCFITDLEIEEWKQNLNCEYPSNLKLENLEDEILLAIDLNEKNIAKDKIIEWKAKQIIWDETNLNKLSSFEWSANNKEGQIFAYERLYHFKTTEWDKAVCLQILSGYYIDVKNPYSAWEKVNIARQHLENIKDWKTVGLGRFMIENAFDVVLTINNNSNITSQISFDWAIKNVKNMKNLHLNLIKKAAKASRIMGDTKWENRFNALYKKQTNGLDL